jgi:hypothetical protein
MAGSLAVYNWKGGFLEVTDGDGLYDEDDYASLYKDYYDLKKE